MWQSSSLNNVSKDPVCFWSYLSYTLMFSWMIMAKDVKFLQFFLTPSPVAKPIINEVLVKSVVTLSIKISLSHFLKY